MTACDSRIERCVYELYFSDCAKLKHFAVRVNLYSFWHVCVSGLPFFMFSSSSDWTAFQNTFPLRMNLRSTASYKLRKNLHKAVNSVTQKLERVWLCLLQFSTNEDCTFEGIALVFFFYSWSVASVSVMRTNFCCSLCTTLFVCIKVAHFLVLDFSLLGCSTRGYWRMPNSVPEERSLIWNAKWQAIRMYCASAGL